MNKAMEIPNFIHVKTLISFSKGECPLFHKALRFQGHHRLSPKLRNSLKLISIRNDTVLRKCLHPSAIS